MILCSECHGNGVLKLYNGVAECRACDGNGTATGNDDQCYVHDLKRALAEITAAMLEQPTTLHANAAVREVLTGIGIDLAAGDVTAALLGRDDILDAWLTGD